MGQTYEKEHLLEVYVDDVNWQALLECPDTGIFWKMSMPSAAGVRSTDPVLALGWAPPSSRSRSVSLSETRDAHSGGSAWTA